MASLYNVSVENLKGIGKKRGVLFNRLGVYSVGDLLEFYPVRYENWADVVTIEAAPENETVCIRATVLGSPVDTYARSGMLLTTLSVYDETSALKIIYFNNKYISSMLKQGETYLFYGKISREMELQMASPVFKKPDGENTMRPVYRQTKGLPSRITESAVREALKMLPETINDPLPQSLREKFSLCDYKTALYAIHFPKNEKEKETARRRLVCQELLTLMLGMSRMKNSHRAKTDFILNKNYTEDFCRLLPYKLTNAQLKTISACVSDMTSSSYPMNRLVQGDVGSGKTAVAAALCYNAVKNGWQAAFMAPTEILAEQHFKSLTELFKGESITVDLLTGALTPAQKKAVREKIASGETGIVIGTHSLITDNTEFNNLGLVITDEQHRFGVAQRAKLLSKGKNPHLLVMSATPIPRTLGLIIYGDLDISVINELPPGRQKVDTFLIDEKIRPRACNFIREQISRGRQAYIVCPLVSEGEGDLAAAEEYAENMMLKEFARIPVGILHGKMKASEKEAVMREFEKGGLSVLVSTTVIEVGVNVPNATVMMIENAERFGLSQLHQLRGRVGRGEHKSYCILVSSGKNPDTLSRLETLCRTNDGFEIADADLRRRGPGDFFGERQHGLPQLSIADFADTESLETAKKACGFVTEHQNEFSEKELKLLSGCVKRLFSKGAENMLN